MALALVPPSTPSPKQALIERVKKALRPPGMLQCSRCGGRTVMTTTNGAWIDDKDKFHKGTVIRDRVCADCDRQGILSDMMPTRPKPVK